jgi:hypothetical protein
MRLSVRSLRRVVKGDLHIEFVRQDLTSYGEVIVNQLNFTLTANARTLPLLEYM